MLAEMRKHRLEAACVRDEPRFRRAGSAEPRHRFAAAAAAALGRHSPAVDGERGGCAEQAGMISRTGIVQVAWKPFCPRQCFR
jgi:hypothetical protein